MEDTPIVAARARTGPSEGVKREKVRRCSPFERNLQGGRWMGRAVEAV